jgi:hypothetical protein
MTTSTDEPDPKPDAEPGGISDDQLPEDLQPTDDNPLAQNPDEGGDEDAAPGGGPQQGQST